MMDDLTLATALASHARAARRLRLEVAALVGRPELERPIERAAAARPGVTRATADARSGRVLIEYAPDAPILDELERLGRRAVPRALPAMTALAPHACWHAEPARAIARLLGTSTADGLSSTEARRRLERYGDNAILDEAPPSRLALLSSQIANLPTALLLGSTVISLLLGDVLEAGAIVTVIGLNVAIGYRVERRSAELLAAWRSAELGTADVVRDGSIRPVPAAELVPGDVLIVRRGDVINADARVVEAHRLAADEAALTGESEPVAKTALPVPAERPLAERSAMLYRGTAIASGHGRAIVVATGAATEIARVQALAAEARAPKGRLQRRLNWLSSRLAWSGLASAALSGLASLAHRRDPVEILRDTVALGVAAIPEGLPVTATAALVRAMARLRERGIVVRRLATAETLGGITVACTDKTGTLTENRMRLEIVSLLDGSTVRRLHRAELAAAPGGLHVGPLAALVIAGVLNSDVEYQDAEGELEVAGSATELALVRAAQRLGLDPRELLARWPRRRLRERRDDIHYVVSEHDGDVAFIKGAPEQVVPLCALDAAAAAAVLAENASLAGDGLRVLAIGWQPLAGRPRPERGAWRYLGLVGLRDPLREGSAEAVRAAERAGIRTIMLTGDQRATAEAIARQAQLEGDVIEGRELARVLAAPDARERMRRIAVVARVTPADKVAIVEALRRHGEVVAMAGDGINDAPALRAADVGIAVGARATDLARQTADIVLERPDLRSILEAVAEGRAVQDNLRRSIRFQAAGNLGELLLALGASLAGRRLIPSLGLLWINLLTDTLPGLALALEPSATELLDRPPRPPGAPILDPGDWRRIARDGALIAGASGAAALVGGPLAAFGAIGAVQFGYAATCRADGGARERRFALLVGGSAALHLLAVATAPARALLGMRGHPALALAASAAAGAAPLLIAWRTHRDHEVTRRGPLATINATITKGEST
jgi:Ca2+-transporting ATPase